MNYFAYGSNMSLARLSARIPSVRRIGVGSLAGYTIVFHKAAESDGSAKCDAFFTGDPSQEVLGVVYEMDPKDKNRLDIIEGVGYGYENRCVTVGLRDGSAVTAWVYCATSIDTSLLPFDWYREHVVRGAIENGLPENYISRIRAVETMRDPDAERAARELSIYSELDKTAT